MIGYRDHPKAIAALVQDDQVHRDAYIDPEIFRAHDRDAVIGATIFANFVNFTTLPEDLRDFVAQFQVHPIAVIVAICVIYACCWGTAMAELSMILSTVPIFFR